MANEDEKIKEGMDVSKKESIPHAFLRGATDVLRLNIIATRIILEVLCAKVIYTRNTLRILLSGNSLPIDRSSDPQIGDTTSIMIHLDSKRPADDES